MPTMTITTNPAQEQRVVRAFGKRLEVFDETNPNKPVPRDATSDEVKRAVIEFLRETVRSVEGEEASRAAVASVQDIDPT